MSEGYSKHCGIVNHLGTDNLLCTVQIHCSHIHHGGRQFIVPCAICCSHIYHGGRQFIATCSIHCSYIYHGEDNWLHPVQFAVRIYIMGWTIYCALFNLLLAYISWGGQFIVPCSICCSHIYLGEDNFSVHCAIHCYIIVLNIVVYQSYTEFCYFRLLWSLCCLELSVV